MRGVALGSGAAGLDAIRLWLRARAADGRGAAEYHRQCGAERGCALVGGEVALAHQLDGTSLVQCQLPDGKRCTERGVIGGRCPN